MESSQSNPALVQSEAASPLEAIALVNHYPYTIDLLLTDVVMPDMSGPELVKQLKPLHPEMQVVLYERLCQ